MISRPLIILLFLILCGCANHSSLPVKVDAIASSDSDRKMKYVLMPGSDSINKTDLQFLEFSRYLDKALISQGFKKSVDNEAQIAILAAYGAVTSAAGYGLVNLMSLRAYDANGKPGENATQVWSVDASTSNMSGDMRRALPYLISAARPYLGKDSRGRVDEWVTDNDAFLGTLTHNGR